MARRLVSFVVALALFLSSSLAAVLLPAGQVLAQFESLKWSPIRTPSVEDFMVVNPSEVSALVLGSSTVWYAADIPNSKLYRTEDGGLTWQDDILDNLLDATPAPTLPVWGLAVAPDDPSFVVAVTDSRQEVYLSDDGGDTWVALNIAATSGWDPLIQIADVAVSPAYNGGDVRDIAVATRMPDGVIAGDVWIMRVDSLISSWKGQALGMDVSSVAFSPNYDDDETIIALVSDAAGTYLVTGYRVLVSNDTLWQVTTPFFIEVCLADEDSPTESELIYSDIAVAPDYDGDNASRRVVFVSYASMADTDDAYRIDDWRVKRLGIGRGEDPDVPVFSIAFDGGTLIAGEVAADGATGRARIHFCDDTSIAFPVWDQPEKRPSGGYGTGIGNAIVAYTPGGQWAVCGTSTNAVVTPSDWADLTLPGGPWSGNPVGSPDESAISRASSGDDYLLWNQISLIDTDIEQLCDYSLWLVGTATKEPGNILYLASAGTGIDSIWRATSLTEEDLGLRWERVDFLDSPTDDIILRRTPESGSGNAVFYAVRDSNLLYRSLDNGQTWVRIVECPEDLTDVAIVSSERIYVLYDNLLAIGQWTKVRQWYIWVWTYDIDTGLKSGNTLKFHGNSYIFAGDNGDEGEVAVSTDGGESFTVLPPLPAAGPVHMVLDDEFTRNRLLYAATENGASGIYRWTVGGAIDWTPLSPPDAGFTGLAHIKEVLYGAFGAGVDRTLIPRAPNVTVMDWDSLTVGLTPGTDFRPDTLRVTVNDMVNLWAIDDRTYDYEAEEGRLWVYADTFVLPTPWPVSPALGEVLSCDMCGCEATLFCFEWKPLPKAQTWDLWVALDEEFKFVLLKMEDIEPWCCDSPGICQFEVPLRFDCNATYYWRVRATGTTEGERVHSRWSPPMHFLVGAGSTLESMHVVPILVAPEAGASGVNRSPGFSWTGFPSTTVYEFELASDNSFRSLLAREDLGQSAYVYPGALEWGVTYFWRVRALSPYPSEWSASSFTVAAQPVPQLVPQASALGVGISALSVGGTPLWVWLVIAVLLLLLVCVIVYVAVSSRRY
jgi:hypothetical protein